MSFYGRILHRVWHAALLILLSCGQASVSAAQLNVFYSLDNEKFEQIFHQFSAENHIELHSQFVDSNKLKVQLQINKDKNIWPDVIIVPSDFIGLSNVNYSHIPASLINLNTSEAAVNAVTLNDHLYGVPISTGNHLLLYYNKQLINNPVSNWQQLFANPPSQPDNPVIAWSYNEMYWLIPVLTAFNALPLKNNAINFNTPAMQQAFSFYKKLSNSGIVNANCNYQCAQQQFESGHVGYLIDGYWAYDRYRQHFNDNLAIAPLPDIQGKKMRSYFSSFVMLFPDQSLNGSHRQTLIKLAEYFQSARVQQQLWSELKLIPVNNNVFNSISATQNSQLQSALNQLATAEPMPIQPEMAVVWEALYKGFNRYISGVLTLEQSTEYMQHIAERTLSNRANE